MAELLHIVAESYDYPQLTEDVLREVSDKEFDAMDKKGPTSVSAFLIRISELIPEVVMKQMISLAKLVDSEVCRPRSISPYTQLNLTVLHPAHGHDRCLWKYGHHDQQADRRSTQ